jgi:hypothetical protein
VGFLPGGRPVWFSPAKGTKRGAMRKEAVSL